MRRLDGARRPRAIGRMISGLEGSSRNGGQRFPHAISATTVSRLIDTRPRAPHNILTPFQIYRSV